MKTWRVIPSLPDYEVSEDGQVKRITAARGARAGKILKPYVREDGYDMFIMRHGGKSIHRKAHQLVAEAYLPPKPEGRVEVRHLDGSRTNNHWTNLAWGSSAENKADMVAHGTRMQGERHPRARFTLDEVIAIRARHKGGESSCVIADDLGISRATISKIVHKQRWTFA